MPLPRMTIRRWMIAVAFTGIILAFAIPWMLKILANRRDEFQAKASVNAADADFDHLHASFLERLHRNRPSESEKHNFQTYYRRAAHLAALRDKYDFASRYPWLPVAPDPPEPPEPK